MHTVTGASTDLNVAGQIVDVGAAERRSQRTQLVDDAADGPDVALLIVRFVLPDLGRHVVRRADLRLCETMLHQLRHLREQHRHASADAAIAEVD